MITFVNHFIAYIFKKTNMLKKLLFSLFIIHYSLFIVMMSVVEAQAQSGNFPTAALIKFKSGLSYDRKMDLITKNSALQITNAKDAGISEIGNDIMVVHIASGYETNFKSVSGSYIDNDDIEYVSPFFVVANKYAVSYSNEFFVKLKSANNIDL